MKTIDTFIQIETKDQYIKDIAYSFQKSKVLFTSLELGVFTIIGNESKSCEQIALEANCNPKALEKLLNTLVNLGFLNKKYNDFSNKIDSLLYLSKESPNYLGDLLHIASLWDNWSNLTEVIRLGYPPDFVSINDKDNEWLESFILASYRASKSYTDLVIKHIPLNNPRRMLDLGAGSANFSIEFAKIYPRLSITAYDLPKVIEITRKFIVRSGLPDRINTLGGDFLKDDIGNEYDFVLMADILTQFSFKTNMNLLKKVYDSLNFGGTIAILDTFYNDSKTGPEGSNFTSLNMLVNTIDGEVLSDTDIWFALREAWFTNIYKINTNFCKSLIIATK
jgi:SAM-dependent methyltransferase